MSLLSAALRDHVEHTGGYRPSLRSTTWLLYLGELPLQRSRYVQATLTIGSMDPYQVFRIFHEIRYFEWETGQPADIA